MSYVMYTLCMTRHRSNFTALETFRLSPEMQAQLEKYAARHDASKGEVIRDALDAWLNPVLVPEKTVRKYQEVYDE